MKCLLDTNVVIIDRFFQRDFRYLKNKQFLEQCSKETSYFSIFSLLELTGIASFNISEKELKQWFYDFGDVYKVTIVSPQLEGFAETWFTRFSEDVFKQIQKKATLGDALILKESNGHEMDAIVSWNKKDFVGRTTRHIFTPPHTYHNMMK